jgi:hypothetical protein
LRLVGGLTTLKGWSVDYVMTGVPLSMLFALWVENELANGAQWAEPSYGELETLDDDIMALKALRHD